tara:strand:+ start:339 stop:587 length:249 start_codon:yes stop_codon:yes gene_type:complete
MKVGDLVTLSSYGRSVSRTGWIKKDDIGIVTKIHKVFRNTYYEVSWVKSHFGWNGQYGGFLNWGHVRNLSRRDLKKVRREGR